MNPQMRTRYRATLALAGAAVLGCAPHGRQSRPAALFDVRRCGLTHPLGESRDATAVRCAEWFIARNGYIDRPVTDTAAMAPESIELGHSPLGWLAARHNTLAPRAVVVCRGAKRGPGFTVGFLRPGSDTTVGRAVTMDTMFQALRVEHVDFSVARARADTSTCRRPGSWGGGPRLRGAT